MAATLSLFDSAMKRARIIRQGQIVQIVVDGGGAFVTTLQEFMPVQKWAMSRAATGNAVTDRGRLFERITILISRPGSMVSTRGSDKYVEQLAQLMNQAGYDLAEWMLPPTLKNLTAGRLLANAPGTRRKAGVADAAGDDGDGAAPPDEPPAARR